MTESYGGDALATLEHVRRERDSLARRCALRFENEQRLTAELAEARARIDQQDRHLQVWADGYADTVAGSRAAKRLLSNILAIVNRHQGCNAEQAMAEIHEVCMAVLDDDPAEALTARTQTADQETR